MTAIVPSALVVDAMNVIGSKPDGWWRDRAGAARRVARALQRLAAAEDRRVVLVLDGAPLPGLAEGRHGAVEVRYARRRGRDAADDLIVELVAQILAVQDPVVEVVTSDRELSGRVRRLGAVVSGAGAFRDRLEGGGSGGALAPET